MSECCGSKNITATRIVLVGTMRSKSRSLFRVRTKSKDLNLIDFKALAQRAGFNKKYSVKVGIYETHSPIGQTIESIGSMNLPGNPSPLRSPVRSAGFRTITPGKPNIPVNLPGSVKPNVVRNREYRCPEGYQFGGRFTDNRMSTCGVQLFDIPSPLGLAIGVIRRLARGSNMSPQQAESRIITGNIPGGSTIDSRRPVIPRVSVSNPKVATEAANKLITDLGKTDKLTARMVRRDGFVLEPVVSAQVLRAIPDNRDMEGAHYLMSVASPDQFGGQELGMLSNTGVTKLSYVIPGGSTISLEKRRPLTVGERRKLGRTVNSVEKISIENDPTARLKEVANETGDGLAYTESFPNIPNANELVSKPGKKPVAKWVDVAFGKGKKAKLIEEGTANNSIKKEVGGKISNIDDAIAHLDKGGSLAEIDPLIIQQVLTKQSIIKLQKLDNKKSIATLPNGNKYTVYSPSNKFEHLSQSFAANVQHAMGLETPDVVFIGQGDARKYAVEDISSAMRGYKVDMSKTIKDFSPVDVARIMVSDWLTDQRDRGPAGIIPISNGSDIRPVLVNNTSSGLIALDKIEITNRSKMQIEDMYTASRVSVLKDYYLTLQENQKYAFKKEVDALLKKAREFNFTNFKTQVYNDGHLSDAEKIQIDIMQRILNQRVTFLTQSKEMLLRVLGNK
jgi:hypothetical protein